MDAIHSPSTDAPMAAGALLEKFKLTWEAPGSTFRAQYEGFVACFSMKINIKIAKPEYSLKCSLKIK